MGHSLAPLPVSLRSALSKGPPIIFTITRPPTLAVPSGGFDTPTEKCPPVGSSEYVTGVLASSTPRSPSLSHPLDSPIRIRQAYPSPPSSYCSSSPQSIPQAKPHDPSKRHNLSQPQQLVTPPLTPESSFTDPSPPSSFLTTLFPRSGLSALKYAKNVQIASTPMDAKWEGVVLELPGKPKTLYINGKGAEHILLRESIVALLDLADESLECSALVIALERSSPRIGELLHSLMYVGGTVVTRPPFQVDAGYVLVGIEV